MDLKEIPKPQGSLLKTLYKSRILYHYGPRVIFKIGRVYGFPNLISPWGANKLPKIGSERLSRETGLSYSDACHLKRVGPGCFR